MSSVAQPAEPKVRVRFGDRVRNFWHRVSEGRQVDDLWRQFAADARAGYGFYQRDVDWENIQKLPHWRRPLHIARQFFWAMMLKMTAARRVLLLVAFVFLSARNYHSPSFFFWRCCCSSWPTKSP